MDFNDAVSGLAKMRIFSLVERADANFDALSSILYRVDSLKGLAEQFVDKDLFGDMPARLASYID